jgi:pimeloyl-ACP methyl ester carboxylesterase
MAVRETRVLELLDGRDLAWMEYGLVDGAPVVAFHGSPGTGSFFAPQSDTAARKGVRLIAPDRPGYGHSTFHTARSYETWTRDVAQLADHLGVDRFSVVGHSSGGPNAAACARWLGDRLSGCAIVSGWAPPEAQISKAGMVRSNRIGQRLSLVAPRLMGVLFEAGLRQGQRAPDQAIAWMRRTLPACDVAVMEHPDIGVAVRADLARPLSATAGRAGVQDVTLERRRWGFRLEDIKVPVHVWHGDADRNVLIANGTHQANTIPDATFHRVPDEGHWLIFSHFTEILDAAIA